MNETSATVPYIGAQRKIPEMLRRDTLHPAALGAMLVVLLALSLSSGQIVIPLLTAFVSILSLLPLPRLDSASSRVKLLRVAYSVGLLAYVWQNYSSENGDAPEVLLAYGAGQWAACEFALRCWLREGFSGEKRAWAALLPALVMMGASNTFETAYVRFLVPLYLLLTILSFDEAPRARPRKEHRPETPDARSNGENENFATSTAHRLRRRLGNYRILALGLVLVCGMASHLTVLIYRYEIGRIGAQLMGERTGPEAVGISTQPRLGATFGASGSLSRVLRIEGLNHNGGLSDEQAYFRVMSFDTYASGSWLPGPDGRKYREIDPAALAVDSSGNLSGNSLRVERLVDDAGLIFAPLHSGGIRFPDGTRLEQARGGPLRSKDPAPEPFLYEVDIRPGAETQGFLCETPTAEERAKLLVIPKEIPIEVRLLAEKIGGGTFDQREQMRLVAEYLQANHQYSLTTNPGAGDPTGNFLLSDKAAHCEYFASAAVILLRCLGVPSRYVVGYYVHESDGGGQAIVRMRDAHAWTECYVDGAGWLTVDATPGGARPDVRNEPVGFWLKLRERMQDAIMLVRNSVARIALQHPLAAGAGLLVCGALYFLARWLWTRRRMPRHEGFIYTGRGEELSQLARRFERWLRRNGMETGPSRTWNEALTSHGPLLEGNSVAREWLRLYNCARFGHPRPETNARLAELLRRLESERVSPRVVGAPTARESQAHGNAVSRKTRRRRSIPYAGERKTNDW